MNVFVCYAVYIPDIDLAMKANTRVSTNPEMIVPKIESKGFMLIPSKVFSY